MTWDADAAYLALRARDARFDGQLYVGVTSTHVYCRPICRVRAPRRENCRFFASAAQAEAAGFRPCLKCRPELAPAGPTWSVMDASRTLARQAAVWVDERLGAQARVTVAGWAAALGISERHLRRIFFSEHGTTPLQYLQTRRLLTAKQLLTDTRLPLAEVAAASGFGSVRRFNAAFQSHYRLAPSQWRRRAATSHSEACIVRLGYRPPYDIAALLEFFEQRAIGGVEHVDRARQEVRRTVRLDLEADADGPQEVVGWVAARFEPGEPSVRLAFSPALERWSVRLVHRVRRWLDLDATPSVIDAALADLPGTGMRLPGSIDAFELSVRAVLGQQVTVAAARTLGARLVARCAQPLATPWPEVHRVFPRPAHLALLDAARLGELGIVHQRALAIQALARAWPRLQALAVRPDAAVRWVEVLQELPGIGPWTAHYIAMRALGWPDAFPPGDAALLKALQARTGSTRWADAAAHAGHWAPWRSYAVMRLWAAPPPATLSAPRLLEHTA